jgi:spermidine/putrescine transport system ATP-binding protein
LKKGNIIELRNISVSFDKEQILDGLNLDIRDGEFITLLGPSGCGKTTTLRLIAGFLEPDEGDIFFEGKVINGVPAYKRQVNTIFQRYALFPHLNVYENIAFGLRIKKLPESEIEQKVKEMLKLVNLEGFEERSVTTLSGGQQQRIAIARALVNKPKVLLLDEPLAALDLKMRQDMQYELKNIHKQAGITFIYVTHDQEEALTLSDTIAVMNQGIIQQIGTPEDIYNEPKNAFVADFIGDSNIIDSTMVHDLLVNILGVEFECVDKGFGNNTPVDVVIRPEDVILTAPEKSEMKGVVTSIIFRGVHYEMDVMANGYEWLVHSTKMEPVGTEVGIYVEPENIQIMHKPRSEDEEAATVDE